MPEGDTIWLTARRLHEALAGRALTTADLRVPKLATVELAGRRVEEVVSRGKHLLARVEGGLTLHSHLRMDGSWHVYSGGQRWQGGPQWQIRAVLGNDERTAVGYRLPVLDLLRTDEEEDTVGHLGPDLLGPDWDPAEALRRLLCDPGRTMGEALLDQRNLAGVGNVYKSELCFLRGVTPWTSVGEVPGLERVIVLAQRLLEANRSRVGHVTTGDTRPGRRNWVYGRAGRPCRRCGTRILGADQGEHADARITFWCPRCQSGPAPEPTRLTPTPNNRY
ncbi:Fpg/Nei family DNA glycosylase [Wenjunlia tyrosinilytica]|uniref:DNA-(apurinic or apyrimidinic site) lyase n=1 Tax=Wenjunlia tyrosinilytica TaxID=1544741 RepID=A0A918DYR1_9ACTN|nr:Fpg/Nei family DNA glycosylase [Wenjunlia tyrosinilytica]GGO91561.1 putative endonuclease 8 2 [Wenjunlia tyrosinilytica]